MGPRGGDGRERTMKMRGWTTAATRYRRGGDEDGEITVVEDRDREGDEELAAPVP
jgi:hypothetical protein